MITIKKVTVKYVASEDRLRLATETANGESLVLWLTVRLAVRLVVSLLCKVAPEPTVENRQEPPAKRQAIQQWEQSAATQVKQFVPAVTVQQTARQFLIHSVDISCQNEGLLLVFRWSQADGARMAFSFIEMRQWLQIVYRQFITAGWPMDVWPQWFGSRPSAPKEPQQMFLH